MSTSSTQQKDKLVKCKGCNEEIKMQYLSSDLLCYKCDKEKKMKQTIATKENETTVKNNTTCSNCGALLMKEALFCGNCGKKTEEVILNKDRFCTNCGKKITDEEKFCSACGVQQTIIGTEKKQKLQGFEGWLALFGLGIFVTPIFIFFSIVSEPNSYGSLGIFFNIVIIISYIWLCYLMIKRKKIFKKWFIGIGIFQLIVATIIALVANASSYIYTEEELTDINVSALRTLFYVIIWGLYLWNSKRVKNTFIN